MTNKNNELIIDGEPFNLSSQFVIRWVDIVEGKSIPVLYRNGKRVVKAWSLNYSCYSKEDLDGGNANTE